MGIPLEEQHAPPKGSWRAFTGPCSSGEEGQGRGGSLTQGKTMARLSHMSSRKPLSFLTSG